METAASADSIKYESTSAAVNPVPGIRTTTTRPRERNSSLVLVIQENAPATVAMAVSLFLLSCFGASGPLSGSLLLPLVFAPKSFRFVWMSLMSFILVIFGWIRLRNPIVQLSASSQLFFLAVLVPILATLSWVLFGKEYFRLSSFLNPSSSINKKSGQTQLVSEILSGISAEIREPLSTIVGWVDLILGTDLKRDTRSRLDIIKSRLGIISSVLDDIQDYSTLTGGLLELSQGPISIFGTIEKAFKDFQISNRSDVEALIDYQLGESEFGLADGRRIGQCIRYILNTASSLALPYDELKVTAAITELPNSPTKSGPRIVKLNIFIRNAWTDIEPHLINSLFDPGKPGDECMMLRLGTRVAMALTKGIIGLMNGEVIITSLPDHGSIFLIQLPLQIISFDEYRTLKESSKCPTRSLTDSSELRILIVDDNPFNRSITDKLLSAMGHQTKTANDGIESVELCEKHHFDLIFMDLAMPRMDGYNATREIRKGPNASSIIVALTASTESQTAPRCTEAGMDGCVSKPVSRSLLLNTIHLYSTPLGGNLSRSLTRNLSSS